MPLATRPDAKYKYVLKSDRDYPIDKQPVFVFKYLSCLDWETIADLSDAFEESKTGKERIRLVFEVISRTLVGWENLPVDFDLSKLSGLLTIDEATELMQAAISQLPGIEDKKKSDAQLPSSMEEYVKTAKE
jgi:hypothetical protein